MIWIFFTFFTLGGTQGIIPGVSSRFFGTVVGSQAIGFYIFTQSVGNWIEYIFILMVEPNYGYAGVFWINFGLLCAALIGSILFNPKIDWTNSYQKIQNDEP